ncbi:MAG: hypothetical protein ACP5NF_02185 [Thermoanaerobaculum sp.]
MIAGVALCAVLAGQEAALRPTLRPVSYFPLQPGTTWVYRATGLGGGERQVTAHGAASPLGFFDAAALLEGYFPGPARLVRSLAGKVEELGSSGEGFLWYLLAAPEGTSWTLRLAPLLQNQLFSCLDGARLTLVSRRESVTVPAGTFDHVALIRWETPCRDAGILAEWFAPGVGLVQREEASVAGQIRWQLQEIRRDQISALPQYGGALALSQRHYLLDLMPPLELERLPVLKGTLALWLLSPPPEGEAGVPLCLEVSGEIEDANRQVLTSFAVPDPGCLVMAPVAATPFRVLPFAQPLVVGGTPLPQGTYTVRLTVETRGWNASFSLPFTVSHVY